MIPVRAVVYAATGRVVQEIYDDTALGGRVLEIRWDGLARNGRRVSGGLYFLRVVAGNQARSAKLFVIE
jgi:hypothetical protein